MTAGYYGDTIPVIERPKFLSVPFEKLLTGVKKRLDP
jgi:hypothetical protein